VLNPDPPVPAARQRLQREHGLRKIAAGVDLVAWLRFERRLMRESDATVVFTRRDGEALRTLAPAARIAEIPFGTTLPDLPLDPRGYGPATLLFVGSFVHPPNFDAAIRLAADVFPRVRARAPSAQLNVVGENPPPELQRLASPGVSILGRVPDLRPYLDQAAVVIAPLRLGGGMRVKVLETLAAGKALVATPLAVEGLGVEHDQQVVLAETDDQLAQAVSDLLADADRRAAIAGAARAWAMLHLGWTAPVEAYSALYEEVVERRRHR
jgi:glycosyltransferase involved in cell wall biosynthesis